MRKATEVIKSFFSFPLFLICASLLFSTHLHSTYNDFSTNPHTSKRYKKLVSKHLLPNHSPIRPALDAIFLQRRATANMEAFLTAGFTLLHRQPRSFILVGRHPTLPAHLVKVYLDDELRLKREKQGWEWLVQRCEGAKKIEKVIKKYGIRHFTVAKKWIYPLPINPTPPSSPAYRRKNEVLVVTDMNLASKSQSLEAWKHVTKEHLKELFIIISNAGGRSYREDNIPLTLNGTFAFIDTEYSKTPPEYDQILPFLSEEMQIYWKKLVQKGGNRLHKNKTAF